MKILLLDDDRDQMVRFADVLRDLGHDVTHASNKGEVDAAAKEAKTFSAAVVDLMMPPVGGVPSDGTHGGFTAGAFLFRRVQSTNPTIAVAIVSATDDRLAIIREAVNSISSSGRLCGFFRKPASALEVAEKLERAVGDAERSGR